jgi:hypothetical protein
LRTLAALALALVILALPVLDLPLRALLIFPALGLLARWSDATPGEPHDP